MKYSEAKKDIVYKGYYKSNKYWYIFRLGLGRLTSMSGPFICIKKDGKTYSSYGGGGSFSFLEEIEEASEEEASHLIQCIEAGVLLKKFKPIELHYQIF